MLLLAFSLLAWLPGFFSLPATDRDESRFAQASKQMIESGDYVRIMNGAEARNKKPIGIYWLQASVARFSNNTALAKRFPIAPYRLPSLLGVLLAILAVARGGEIFAGRRAWWAGAWLACSLLAVSEAHLAKTDAALLGVTTAAMLLLARAFLRPGKLPVWQAAAFWLAMAAGILIKGPITPLVVALTLVTVSLWCRRWRWLLALRPGWGVALMLLAVLPWFVAIEIATKGAFFAQSVGGDLAGKLSGSSEGHGQPFGTYLALMPLFVFPAAGFVLGAVPAAWRDRAADETRFLLCWLAPGWVMFEIVHTKLPHYVLPFYPALFLLAARYCDVVPLRGWRVAGVVLTLLAGVVIAAVAVVAPHLLHGAWWIGIPAAVAALGIAVAAVAGRKVWALLLVPVMLFGLFEVELPRLPGLFVSQDINDRLQALQLGGLRLGTAGYDEPSLRFLAGTGMVSFPNGALLADWVKANPGAVALVEQREMGKFLAAGPGVKEVGEVDGYDYSNGKSMAVVIFH